MTMKVKGAKSDLSFRLLILIFVVPAAGILAAGHFFYSNYANNYRTQVEHQLSAVADLKVTELVQWRNERLGDANQLCGNLAFSRLVQRYFEHPDDIDAQEQLRSWLTAFQVNYQYARVFLLDTRGAGRIFVPDTAEPVPRHIPQDAQEALQAGKVTILDLDRDEDTPEPHMVVLVPIFKENDGNQPLGVVVMRIDPGQYLYPLISRWPTPSATAETLIVRRDGNDVLYLNELKYQKDTTLKLRSSLDNIKMPAVQAALGYEGIMEGEDYRGVAVIADVRHIPDSPWFMVSRVDTSEVYAPLTQALWVIIALVSALLIVAGAAVGLIWWRQNVRVYKERTEIAEALRASEFRYRDLVNNSKNGVAVYEAAADGEDFVFKDFNRAAESIDNVKKEDLIGKSLLQVFPGTKEFGLIEVLQRVWRTGVPERHPLRWYHDERISGWRDSYIYRLSSNEIVAIYEDVTERKQAEEALLASEALLRATGQTAKIGGWELDLATNQVSWTEEIGRIHGVEPGYQPNLEEALNFYAPESRPDVEAALKKAAETGEPYDLESLLIPRGNKDKIWIRSIGKAVYSGGKVVKLTGTFQNIDKYKSAEEALKESEELFRVAQEMSPDGFTILLPLRDEKGEIIDFTWVYENNTIARINGTDPEEVKGKRMLDLFPTHKGTSIFEAYINVSNSGKPQIIEEVYVGEIVSRPTWLRLVIVSIGENIAILAQDITEGKQAEEKRKKSRQELRNLSVHLLSLREEERKLLAREIHDELGQTLTALKMDLSWLSKKLPRGQAPLAEKTASMLKLVDTTVTTVKQLSTRLRPGMLDDLGLVAALEWQAGEFEERTGIKINLSFEPADIRVDAEQSIALFRIFQELLTNVARHAAATRIDACLQEKDGALELSVRDNGKGIKPKMLTDSKSFGLIGMRERCHHLGGTVDIRGKPGKGTSVTVNLPAREKRA